MTELHRVDFEPIPASVMPAFCVIAAAVGASSFYKEVGDELERHVPVDRFYVFEGRGRTNSLQALHADTEEDKPPVSEEMYAKFLSADPIQAAIEAALDNRILTRVDVRPHDIVVPAYREMMERARVTMRVSFVSRHGRGWRCTTVVRRDGASDFSKQELDWLGGFVRVLSPLIDRHRVLVGEVVEDRVERLLELEQRFADRFPELTLRERQVCARAAIGVSIEGSALDLGIGSSSILTYRKRAYHRLGVTSSYELARLVMR